LRKLSNVRDKFFIDVSLEVPLKSIELIYLFTENSTVAEQDNGCGVNKSLIL